MHLQISTYYSSFNLNLETLLYIIQFINFKHVHSFWTLPLHFYYYSIMSYSVYTYISFSVLHCLHWLWALNYICRLFNLTSSLGHFDLQFLPTTLTNCRVMKHLGQKELKPTFLLSHFTQIVLVTWGICVLARISYYLYVSHKSIHYK